MGFCSSFDADTFFAYDTAKIVRVRDKWLGIIQLIFRVIIFGYIIIKVLVLDHSFNVSDQPDGFVRLSLESPHTTINYADYPYCPNNPKYDETWPFPQERSLPETGNSIVCQAWDPQQVRFPLDELNSIFLTTRATIQNTQYHCGRENNNTSPTIESSCSTPYSNVGEPTVTFLAGLENYTLGIQHAYFSSQFTDKQFTGNSREIDGKLYVDGKAVHDFPATNSERPDIISLSELLSYAGVSLSEPSKNVNNSLLYSGTMLLITVSYSNDPYNHKRVSYEYHLHPISHSDYKLYELSPSTTDPNAQVSIKRAGVKIIFVVSGKFVRFSLQELLIQIVTALGLLSIANYSVDFLMCNILKLRPYYRAYKFEETDTLHHLHLNKKKDQESQFIEEQSVSEEGLYFEKA